MRNFVPEPLVTSLPLIGYYGFAWIFISIREIFMRHYGINDWRAEKQMLKVEVNVRKAKAISQKYQPIGFWLQLVVYKK